MRVERFAMVLVVLACGSCDPGAPAGVAGPPDSGQPVSGQALAFELTGRLNPYDAALRSEQATYAVGGFRLHLAGQEEVLDEEPLIFRYVYPAGAGALAGKEVVVLRALSLDPTSTDASLRVALAQVVLPRDVLAAPYPGAPLRLPAARLGLSASVRDVTLVHRADDVSLNKDCYRAALDTGNDRSYLEVRRGGAPPVVGAVLSLGGELALASGAELDALLAGRGLERHHGRYCTCFQDARPIPCATFEAESKKSGEELSCSVPAGFLQSTDARATLTFKGPINSGVSQAAAGLASASAQVGGKTYSLSYRSHAVRYTFQSGAWTGKDIVEIISIGDVQNPTKTRVTYNVMFTRVRADLLARMKAEGLAQPPPDVQLGFVAYLLRAEEVRAGADSATRLCPLAVTGSAPGSFVLCHESNKSFAVGERLELAASLALDDDPQVIAAWLGSGCFCSKNQATIPCADFPEP